MVGTASMVVMYIYSGDHGGDSTHWPGVLCLYTDAAHRSRSEPCAPVSVPGVAGVPQALWSERPMSFVLRAIRYSEKVAAWDGRHTSAKSALPWPQPSLPLQLQARQWERQAPQPAVLVLPHLAGPHLDVRMALALKLASLPAKCTSRGRRPTSASTVL